jgi:hypothetical protein
MKGPTPIDLPALTDAALDRHFSPGRAARLRELMRDCGLGLDTVARAHKILVGLGVSPKNDKRWMFSICDGEPVGLEIWNPDDGTFVTVQVLRPEKSD